VRLSRQKQYQPLLDRTLENYQIQHLARRFDFGKESRIAHLLVHTINARMDEAERAISVTRLAPWSLYLNHQGKHLALPLLRPDYLQPMLRGGDFSAGRERVRQACIAILHEADPEATEEDLLARIDPWALARRRGPHRYVDCLQTESRPPGDGGGWRTWIDALKPKGPIARLNTLDLSIPEPLLDELTHFVSTEAGLGRIISRRLVEETVTLRNACCPRPSQLQSGEMLVLATHVKAHPSVELAARFRRSTPVVLSVWKPGELGANHSLSSAAAQLEQLKRRLVRVCFEAYRQNGLLSQMDLQWIFQISSARVSELLRSAQREQNVIVPTPGTILDAGRSMTHKDIIVGLHLQGYSVREITRMTYHSPIAVDNYIGTFESVLVLKLYDMPPFLMARLLRRGVSLIEEHLNLIERLNIDERDLKEYLLKRGVSL